MMSLRVWGMIVFLAAIWGGSFFFGRVAVLEVPPLTVVFFRVFLAAVTLWVFILLTGRRFVWDKSFVAALAIMSILNNVIPFSMILYGQTEIGSGLAAIVNAMTPIWTLIIANFATADEKFSANKIIGILLGFAGVAVLMGADWAAGLRASVLAQAAVLTATISYGFAGVFGKRFKGRDPIIVSAGQLTASTVFVLPLAFFIDQPLLLSLPSTGVVLSILGLAVLCTAFAYVLFFSILSSAGATNVSLVTFLVPVSAIVLGVVFLGEVLTTTQLLGMGLIACGLAIIDGRIVKKIQA